jgi:O-antigen/teichoic acid export membrane protein
LIIIATPIISRLYSPIEFGVFGLATAVASVAGTAAAMRVDSLIPVLQYRSDARALTVGVVTLAMVVAASVVPLAWYFVSPDWAWPTAVLVALGAFGVSMFEIAAGWMVREARPKSLALRGVTQAVVQVSIQVAGGIASLGANLLIAGYALGRLSGAIIASPRTWWRSVMGESSGWARALRQHGRQIALGGSSSLLNSLGTQAPILIVSFLLNTASVGFLALTLRVLGGPSTVMGQAVARTFQVEAGDLIRRQEVGLTPLATRTMKSLAGIGLVPLALLLVWGPMLFEVAFGSEWADAGGYARILAAAFYLQFVVSPVARTAILVGRTSWLVLLDASRLVLMALMPTCFHLFLSSPGSVMLGLSCALAVSYFLNGIMVLRFARDYDGQVARRTT